MGSTTADRDAIAAMVRDRWDTLTIGVDRYQAEETNTRTIRRYQRAVRELAGGMVHGVEPGAEYSRLCELEDRLVGILEDEIIAFALAIETDRAAERKGAAA
jgi:hypothetical protein